MKLGNNVSRPEQQDADKVYVQIGTVEPYFAPEELAERTTEWQRVFNIRTFQMDQPFTLKGGAQGSHAEQWIRRLIFTTEHALPHIEKRVRVVSKQARELSPIESATLVMGSKVQALKNELNARNPRLKILQRELQGALLMRTLSLLLATPAYARRGERWPAGHRRYFPERAGRSTVPQGARG